MNPNNEEFLKAIFGKNYTYAHVTDFNEDPNNIPAEKHLVAWSGDYYKNYSFSPLSNQYFTISLFAPDEHGKARRRKALYSSTPCIVLDDVKEKLPLETVNLLPSPSWILETSHGSEQWGYILQKPCTERAKVENLLDGLVAQGLAPNGKDPGMKGVTRYVRLPGGVNTKSSKLINGIPFKCRILKWQPFQRVTLDSLAKPFSVDLDAVRRESRVDGAANVSDNPLIHIPDILNIKEVRSDGRYDVTCPWVEEHTDQADNGAAIFTNADGTIGFKCHHGSCEGRHAGDLLNSIEEQQPGFKNQFNVWEMSHKIKLIEQANSIPTPPNTLPIIQQEQQSEKPTASISDFLALVRAEPFTSEKALQLSGQFLKLVDTLPEIEKVNWHKQLKDVMRWTNAEFKSILNSLRTEWYSDKRQLLNFYSEVVYVGELNQFYDCDKRIFYTPDGYQNMYSHLDSEVKKETLQNGRGTKVHKLDYYPDKPQIWEEGGIKYANTWSDKTEVNGAKGEEIDIWLNHFDVLGWSEHRDHIIKWMAFTLQKPGVKINHMLLFGSHQGAGKDFLLKPLITALGDNSNTIDGDELVSNYNGYVMGVKHVHVNEMSLGGRAEAKMVTNKLKRLCTAPPYTLRVRELYVKPMDIRNLINVTMTTNSQTPLELDGQSRRIFALWSHFTPRDDNGVPIPKWEAYWRNAWEWMDDMDGVKAVIHYLRYEVDISDFEPGLAPPVTDFLSNITENSKHPVEQTLEYFIKSKRGIFNCDILTGVDIARAIRTEVAYIDDILCEQKYFTPSRVNQFMMNIPWCKQVKISTDMGTKNAWMFRNQGLYDNMFATDLGLIYIKQLNDWRNNVNRNGMTVVR